MKTNEPEIPVEIEDLPPPTRDRIRDMLIEGATFEDIVETINSVKGPTVTEMMVNSYFRRNLDVQKGRVCHEVERAEELKKAIGNPKTAEGQLASAAFLTGFMRLTRKSADIGPIDAESARMRRENLALERQILQLRKQKHEKDMQFMRAHIRHEWAKFDVLRGKLRQIEATLKTLSRGEKLDGATLAKIREMYGIISEPFFPPQLEAEKAEPAAS